MCCVLCVVGKRGKDACNAGGGGGGGGGEGVMKGWQEAFCICGVAQICHFCRIGVQKGSRDSLLFACCSKDCKQGKIKLFPF